MPETGGLNPYLTSIDVGDPSLAGSLDSAMGGLLGAVPPAGQYITSGDYTTLYAALSQQYVSEVIQQYEATLGPSPELYAAALEAGYLTPEQAQALQSQSTTTTGSLMQKYGAQGGLRAVAGPYQAARTQLLEQALSDIQSAAQKASSDAFQLAQMPTEQRIRALAEAGRLGLGLVNAGVSRRNAVTAAEAAGPQEQGPLQVPAPPQPPGRPSLFEQSLPALIAAAGPLAALLLRQQPKAGEEAGRESARMEAAKAEEARRLNDPNYYDEPARRIVNQIGEAPNAPDPTTGVINPYADKTLRFGDSSYGGDPMSAYPGPDPAMAIQNTAIAQGYGSQGYGQSSAPAWQQPIIDWSQPQWNPIDPYGGQYPGGAGDFSGQGNQYYNPQYDPYQNYQYDYAPAWSSPGGYDDPWQGYDWSAPAYDANSWSGSPSSGYWV